MRDPDDKDLEERAEEGIFWLGELREDVSRSQDILMIEDPDLSYAGFRIELNNPNRWDIPSHIYTELLDHCIEHLLAITDFLEMGKQACRKANLYWAERVNGNMAGERGLEADYESIKHVSNSIQYAKIIDGDLSVETPNHEEIFLHAKDGALDIEFNPRCPKRKLVHSDKETCGLYSAACDMIVQWIRRKGFFYSVQSFIRHPDYYTRWIRKT